MRKLSDDLDKCNKLLQNKYFDKDKELITVLLLIAGYLCEIDKTLTKVANAE